MKVVAFVPARGESSKIPNKNLQIFDGEPLYLYTVRKLLSAELIDEVYVDSEDEHILALAQAIGARPLRRDPRLATKATDGHELLANAARQVEADVYLQVLCTSPFVELETIARAVEALRADAGHDSVVLVEKQRSYRWVDGRPAYGDGRIPNRDSLPEETLETLGLYAVRRSVAIGMGRRFGERVAFLEAKPVEAVQVNTVDDLRLAKFIAAGIRADEVNYLRLIKTVLSSPILSDVCDEMGLESVLAAGYVCNVPGAKILGRARTLNIRAAGPQDPPDAIYKALESYRVIADNDVIVVATERPELAYFGEINMSLAIRAGASGAIISGVTRDVSRTIAAQYPVFSKGRYCKDIKGKGAVGGINVPIEVDGVALNFGDLVFADDDGIVVLPRRHERAILKRALEVVTSESGIISDILRNVKIADLVARHGNF